MSNEGKILRADDLGSLLDDSSTVTRVGSKRTREDAHDGAAASPSSHAAPSGQAPTRSRGASPRSSAKKGAKGRSPIRGDPRSRHSIEYVEDKQKRAVSFSKRRQGLMKKAYELAARTGSDVLVVVASETGNVFTYASDRFQPMVTLPEAKNMICNCLDAPDYVPDVLLPFYQQQLDASCPMSATDAAASPSSSSSSTAAAHPSAAVTAHTAAPPPVLQALNDSTLPPMSVVAAAVGAQSTSSDPFAPVPGKQ